MARVERAQMRDASGVVWRCDVLEPGAVGRAQAVAVQVRVDRPGRESAGGEVGHKRHAKISDRPISFSAPATPHDVMNVPPLSLMLLAFRATVEKRQISLLLVPSVLMPLDSK